MGTANDSRQTRIGQNARILARMRLAPVSWWLSWRPWWDTPAETPSGIFAISAAGFGRRCLAALIPVGQTPY